MTLRLIIISICVLTLGACGHRSDPTNDKTTATVDTALVIKSNPKPCDTTRLAQANAKGKDYIERFDGKDARERFIMLQVDSIYFWSEGKSMSEVLFDLNFDNHVGFWPSFHTPISLRKEIFDSICDCSLLQKILVDTNKRLDLTKAKLMILKKQPYDRKVPLSEYSIRELTRMRYKELDCK